MHFTKSSKYLQEVDCEIQWKKGDWILCCPEKVFCLNVCSGFPLTDSISSCWLFPNSHKTLRKKSKRNQSIYRLQTRGLRISIILFLKTRYGKCLKSLIIANSHDGSDDRKDEVLLFLELNAKRSPSKSELCKQILCMWLTWL